MNHTGSEEVREWQIVIISFFSAHFFFSLYTLCLVQRHNFSNRIQTQTYKGRENSKNRKMRARIAIRPGISLLDHFNTVYKQYSLCLTLRNSVTVLRNGIHNNNNNKTIAMSTSFFVAFKIHSFVCLLRLEITEMLCLEFHRICVCGPKVLQTNIIEE